MGKTVLEPSISIAAVEDSEEEDWGGDAGGAAQPATRETKPKAKDQERTVAFIFLVVPTKGTMEGNASLCLYLISNKVVTSSLPDYNSRELMQSVTIDND